MKSIYPLSLLLSATLSLAISLPRSQQLLQTTVENPVSLKVPGENPLTVRLRLCSH